MRWTGTYLARQQLVAALALLPQLVPPPRRDDPAGAVLLAGVHHVLFDGEGVPARQREPVGPLELELALVHLGCDQLLRPERLRVPD